MAWGHTPLHPYVLMPGAWVGQEAVVTVDAQGTQSLGVGWCVSDCVQNLSKYSKKKLSKATARFYFHVPDVMDVQRLLQADYQSGPVELHGQDGIAIAVLTNFSA